PFMSSAELAVREPKSVAWTRRHLLGLEELSRVEIETVLNTAEEFVEVSQRRRKKRGDLKGKVVVNLFFEPSTRTRTSFGLAAKRLSADTQDFVTTGSSVSKGETFIDTAKNIEAMGIDVIVVRHSVPGAPHRLDDVLPRCDVVNMLRIQFERQRSGLFPSIGEYFRLFGMTAERMRRARPDVLLLAPGPINRGVELTAEVADGPNSAILQQVANGLAVRMAVLYLLCGQPGAE